MVGPSVEVRDASRAYALGGGRVVHALDHVSFSIPAGAFAVVMGPNGSGKTSLLGAVGGSLCLESGNVALTADAGVRAVRPQIVYVAQDPRTRTFDRLTLAEHFLLGELAGKRPRVLSLGVTRKRIRRYAEMLRKYQRDDLVPFLERPARELSGGMRQALSLLLTVTTPQDGCLLLLLDEPTGSLDATNEQRCLELVARFHASGATVLLVTHDPRLASLGDTLLVLHEGRLLKHVSGQEKAALTAGDIAAILGKLVATVTEMSGGLS